MTYCINDTNNELPAWIGEFGALLRLSLPEFVVEPEKEVIRSAMLAMFGIPVTWSIDEAAKEAEEDPDRLFEVIERLPESWSALPKKARNNRRYGLRIGLRRVVTSDGSISLEETLLLAEICLITSIPFPL